MQCLVSIKFSALPPQGPRRKTSKYCVLPRLLWSVLTNPSMTTTKQKSGYQVCAVRPVTCVFSVVSPSSTSTPWASTGWRHHLTGHVRCQVLWQSNLRSKPRTTWKVLLTRSPLFEIAKPDKQIYIFFVIALMFTFKMTRSSFKNIQNWLIFTTFVDGDSHIWTQTCIGKCR